ncbi:zinc finger protein CONSTANS-LIKE 16-like [Nicotiana sylvestris]|uniref:zinc finger protein CONSTANS-LIKE 16-like n=1 Tax=Nicotiana sylvestris TaxID=4096 RepID=UPI00388C9B20
MISTLTFLCSVQSPKASSKIQVFPTKDYTFSQLFLSLLSLILLRRCVKSKKDKRRDLSMSMGKKNRKSKTKSKRRKPKFLSLSLQLSDKKSQPSDHVPITSTASIHDHQNSQQLNLFPLHPENLVDDKDSCHDENVALFFSGAENSATTLTELLTSSKDEIDSNQSGPNYMTVSSSEARLKYADTYRGKQGELVRTALRNKERENKEEEKWVVYSDVVDLDQHSETTRKEEEVSSCSIDRPRKRNQQQQLSLKLDYEEILNAWSDKGSLYLQAESSQIVPDINGDFLNYETSFSSHGLMGGWDSSTVLYRVPEFMASEQSGGRTTESLQEDELKVGRREASVLRYKEKRQNRLFSKKIRYQVRKLNAEKRPRVKGRFVKRD